MGYSVALWVRAGVGIVQKMDCVLIITCRMCTAQYTPCQAKQEVCDCKHLPCPDPRPWTGLKVNEDEPFSKLSYSSP